MYRVDPTGTTVSTPRVRPPTGTTPRVRPHGYEPANYDMHCPRWALGFQKLAHAAGAKCFVKFPGHPADEAAKDIWDFVFKKLRP